MNISYHISLPKAIKIYFDSSVFINHFINLEQLDTVGRQTERL